MTNRSPILTAQPVVATHEGVWLLGRSVTADAPERLAGGDITALAVGPDGLWVLESGEHVHRLDPAGSSEHVASLPAGGRGTSLARHAGDIWVGGDPARLWRVSDGEARPVPSFESAPTSDEWHTPWGGPAAVFSLASHGDALFVSVHVGGILRTTDAGRTWSPTIDLHDDVHQVVADAGGTLWAATGMRGLAQSDDGGETWRYHTEGLHATYALAVAAIPGGALVGVSSGHAGRDGGLYRFNGSTFTRCRDGLPDDFGGAIGPRRLAALGERVVASMPHGDLYGSDDGGATWSLIAQLPGITEVTVHALT